MSNTPAYQRFFAELKRRKVFRIMAVYGAVGFLLLQVVELLIPALLLPEWTYRLVALLMIVGFPIAIILAWAFESTPDGFQRTDAASEAELSAIASAPPAKRWPAGVAALVATGLFAGAVYTGLRASSDDGERAAATGAPADQASAVEASRQAVAVLPFSDLAGTDDSRAFALGLHDDLLTQLTQVPDLKVTSRTSVMAYADQNRPVREIAAELGVGSIVEGGVRTSGGRVRLNVQLIDAATDEHLWAHTYDSELTAETVFEIQGEIARAVATALEATLSEETGAALGAVLTENIDAWNAYHEGKVLEERSGDPKAERATIEAYRRAVELDPGFKAAWARLVRAQAWLLRGGYESDTLPARRSLDSLRAIDPGGADALYAEGVYDYYAKGDYEAAADALARARGIRPGDPEILQHEGWVLRRLGRWDEAMELIDRAIQLDPRNPTLVWNQGLNNYRLRRYGAGRRQFELSLELDPESPEVGGFFTELLLFEEGDSTAARRQLETGRGLETPGEKKAVAYWLAYMARDYGAAIEAARGMYGEPAEIEKSSTVRRSHSRFQRLALAYHMAGDERAATVWADSAVAEAEAALARAPDTGPRDRFGVASVPHAYLGLSLALRGGPGDAEEAVREAEEAVRMYGYDRDAADTDLFQWLLLRTYVLTGRPDDAIALLEELMSRPGVFGLGDLKLDPLYDPLRDDPRFQALIPLAEAQIEW